MARLKNPRHETFIRHLLEGKDITTAFELAGFNRDSGNANRLFRNPKVKERLAELQNEIAAKVPITIESLIAELEEVRVAAGSKNQFAAAVRAVLGKAQLAGLLVERSKVEVTNNGPLDKAESMEEIAYAVVDSMLEYKFEPYHDFRPEDRERLALMWLDSATQWSAAADEYIEEVRRRPLKRVTHLPKSLPSPLNGKAPDNDSQPTTD
jgi:hypothetical protein